MADPYRPKATMSSSTKAAYGVKGKAARLPASPMNQQPPGAAPASVLPRINRRGELPQKPPASSLLPPHSSAKNGGLSILLPPRRPTSKDAAISEDSSPTFHGDELEGTSAKSAWCTPRGPAPEIPTGANVASFFEAPEGVGGYDGSSVVMPTPLRLQSVEESINANEERYRVDMKQLMANNNKFFEISMSANQHLDHVYSQLPNISEAFEQTESALQSLSSDIATLHQQHETATREMDNQFEAAMSSNTDEIVALSEAHTAEKNELVEVHDRERRDAENVFRGQVAELEERYNQMEKAYLDELQGLRQASEAQMQTLQDANRAKREEQEGAAKAQIEALQVKAKEELESLRSNTQSAYRELQERSQTELAELQRTSSEQLAAVKKSLTAEISMLKQNSATNLDSLGERSERELQELRVQGDEALQKLKIFYFSERGQLLQKSSEEISRLRMFEIDQSTHMDIRRVQETKALQDEIDATETNYSTQIRDLHLRYTSELEVLQATSEGEKTLLLQAHASEMERVQTAAAQELSQTIASYEERLRSMTEAHAAEVARNKEDTTQAREALIDKYESDLTSLQNERVREKDSLILHYEMELEAVKRSSRDEHDKNTKLHDTQVTQLRDAHSAKVLALEMAMREQNKLAEDTAREKDTELDSRQGHIDVLEAGEIALKEHHTQYAERSLELVEQKNMALCELESEIWRLDQLNVQKDATLDGVNRALKVVEEDLQVKANTILELTFVIKSRDDEVEKLRNALLDTVQTVNTKTEILELTTETLSSKAKELEATKNALRLESGRLSMVEESMSQKVGLLENTELKMESMRLNMENMRLEMKRMQMDMKLQLEHTEGEIELKNGEIRRLHGTQSELKQKNDFCQQTIERLEGSLAFAQRQGDEAQRRVELLRLEATQSAEEMKKVCDELLGREQELVIMTKEKQTIAAEKQRLHIQFSNLTRLAQTLHEEVELHTMQAEEIQCQCQKSLEENLAEKDERMRSERNLHMLELSAAKDAIRHLEGVEGRLSDTSLKLEALASEKQHLEVEVQALNLTLKKYESTDRLLQAAREDIEQKNTLIGDKVQQLAGLSKQLLQSEKDARHYLDSSRMELEDSISNAHRLTSNYNELARLNGSLAVSLSSLRAEKEQLMLSLGQEKKDIVSRAESLQEKVAGLRKEGTRAASELSDLQHALIEKKKDLAYLQENLGEQTAATRRVKSALDVLSKSHTELQAQFVVLGDLREQENREHLDTVHSLQQSLDSKAKECETLQQSLDIQRQELDLLMAQHDSHVMQLTDGHRSEAVQLIESHRAQIAQLGEDHVSHVTKMADVHLIQVTKLKEDRQSEVFRLSAQLTLFTEAHQIDLARLSEDHRSEVNRLRDTHRDEIDRLTDDLHYQVSELTIDRLSQITEQAEDHRTEVARLKSERDSELARLIEAHRSQIAQLAEGHRIEVVNLADEHRGKIDQMTEEHQSEIAHLGGEHRQDVSCLIEEHQSEKDRLGQVHHSEMARLSEERRSQIDRLDEEHSNEITHLTAEQHGEITLLQESHRDEVDRLADNHRLQVSELTVDRLSYITEQTEERRTEVARLEGDRNSEVAGLTEAHRRHVTNLTEEHLNQISRLSEEYQTETKQLEQERNTSATQLKEDHINEVAQLTVAHLAQITELSEGHRIEVTRLEEDRDVEVTRLREDHRSEVDQLIGAHQNYVNQLRAEHYDGFGLLREEYDGKRKEIDANFADTSSKERTASRHVKLENQQLRDQQRVKTRAMNQQQMMLKEAADERIRLVCAHSLELMTINVAHQQETHSMEQHAAQMEQAYCKQMTAFESQNAEMAAEHAQTLATMKQIEMEHVQLLDNIKTEHDKVLKGLESKYAQALEEMKQQHDSETEAARQSSQEQFEQAAAEHTKLVDERNETFTQSTELMRLRLTEDHLKKVNELLERSQVEEERHTAALASVREELSDKSNTLKGAEDTVTALKAEISDLETQLQDTKQEVSERGAVVAAKNATIDNVRKELNLLMESSKSSRSSEQFVALLRQQLETHMMEVYHVELDNLAGFALEEEGDLLECLKGFFAMRCYRGVAPQRSNGHPESSKAVTDVDEVRVRLQEFDSVVAALDQVQSSPHDSDTRISPSQRISSCLSELGRLKLQVSKMFVSTNKTAAEEKDVTTEFWVPLLQNLSDLFEMLAIPKELESAFIRSRQVISMLKEHENLMSDAQSSSLKDDIQSMRDVRELFVVVDHVLARAREVTRSDKFVRLGDLTVLFDEWEALHKELDNPDDEQEAQPALAAGNYLRSAEILALKDEAATFVQRCKDALSIQADGDDTTSPDDVVEAIEQLMRILQHFELLQPKLGSPRRQPTALELTPTLENKVAAVLAFVGELQLMADFAQNILSDDSKNEGEPASNESSRSSLEALRALTRALSPTATLEELQIDVDLAEDDAMQDFEQNLCQFSNEEGDKQREAFFSSPAEDKSSSRSPSPFLADSLMDISLVMSDHQRLLSQTARWVAKSRQGGAHSQTFSVGTEISRLVREHCALLSLSRRLFKMKDPRQELVSLLEGVALLERMTGRLAVFQTSAARDTDEMSCHSFPDSYGGGSNPSESATSLRKIDVDSIESLPRPVLASIGDMARHLQDYDYFLQQIKVDEGRLDRENNPPAAINIEALVQELNDRVTLVEQSKELLGLQNPMDELPPFLVGAQEVLRQAKQLRESSVCFEKSTIKAEVEPQDTEEAGKSDNGIEAVLSEMDAVIEDLRSYNGMLAWMKQVLPQPMSVQSVADLKNRLNGVLTQVETLTSENTSLMEDKASLEDDLEQMVESRDLLVQEASNEGVLLQELATLYAQMSPPPAEEASTRIALLQSLIKQQQRAYDDAQQRRADLDTEIGFLRLRELLSNPTDGEDADKGVDLSVSTRIEIYNRLLECADNLRSEKYEAESTLKAKKNEVESSLRAEIQQTTEKLERVNSELAQARQGLENALAEERAFLQSKGLFSSVLDVDVNADGAFSRIGVYQQLHDEIAHLLSEKRAVENCATQEYEFLKTHDLLTTTNEEAKDADVPAMSALSTIRLEVFKRLVASLQQFRQLDDDLVRESRFLLDNSLPFDLNEPHNSRLTVYQTLLAGQNALIEEKMEREVVVGSEKAFLASHGVPAFDNAMEIYEQFVQARKQLADLTTELEEEVRFLGDNHLRSSSELVEGTANLTTPFTSSFRLQVYSKLLQTEAQAREANQLLKENMEQQLSRQIADDESVIISLTAKVERLEASLMAWQECAYASQREWDRMLLEEEEKRRSLARQHEDAQRQATDEHARALEEVTKARDKAVALASATHAEALEQATKEHEWQMAGELHKQVQQLELAVFVHAENEAHKQTSDASISDTPTSISAAQTRAQLLEKFTKRDTTAISMIYKAIRLATDILSAAPTASATLASMPRTITSNVSEVSTDVTQSVLACVKELKSLKEFLVQSLEQVVRDDDQVPPPFAKASYAKWMADAVTRATADKECAIDFALCSHREFMGFAEVQLLTRQEEVEKALARVYEKLKTAAANGAFTADQEKLLALELEVTREREARENVACKFRLNEEYYRRLLDERKEMEIAQAANVEGLRDESEALRLKLEKLEQQIQQQAVLPQFRPPSSNTYTSSPRAAVVSPQVPRVLKSAAISNVPMPMRPERPRGGGSAHKERFVSDLERETGQRRTSTTARRLNEWKAREDVITENSGSQLEQDFRAMQSVITSHHTPAMEPVVPTAMVAPATAPGSSLQNQELWYQGVRSIHYVSFFISIFHVPRQQLFRVEVFNSDTEQQQQTAYVTWAEMEAFLQESRKAVRLGIALPADPEMAVTVPQHVRAEIIDVLFERVRVYGEGTENILLGFE